LYTLKAEVATPVLAETPIQFIVDGLGTVKGILVAVQDFDVLVILQQDLGENIKRAKITSDPGH